jgi:predicted GTPase
MQDDLRDNFERDIKSSIRQSIRKNNPDMSIRESNEIASQKTGEIMNKLVALHEPDMVSGGYN